MFGLGSFVIVFCLYHADSEGSNAQASVAFLGSITGGQRIVGIFLGVAIVTGSLTALWKMARGYTGKEVVDTKNRYRPLNHATETGRTIAALMKKNRQSTESETEEEKG